MPKTIKSKNLDKWYINQILLYSMTNEMANVGSSLSLTTDVKMITTSSTCVPY